MRTAKTDQTRRLPTGHFVGFVMLRLNLIVLFSDKS